MKKCDELPDCPVATTVQILESKWKILILQKLLQRPWRFNELQRSLEGVSRKVLSSSLRSMEADGIIRREVKPEAPVSVEYSLTNLGETLRPLIASMEEWGMLYKKMAAKSEEAQPS